MMTTAPSYRDDSLEGTFTFQGGGPTVFGGGVGDSSRTDLIRKGPGLGIRATIVPLDEQD